MDAALEDFGIPGTISDEVLNAFGVASLKSDPYQAIWSDLFQFNKCSPPNILVPTLMLQGDQDTYLSEPAQLDLFKRLGCSEKQWVIIPNSDHVVHLLHNK